ncbi:MAG: hypothetical protein FWH08_04950 [Oscillospiraceae bacterium]|nr:hypothetical protein [Oscillospiraceae bacterium]
MGEGKNRHAENQPETITLMETTVTAPIQTTATPTVATSATTTVATESTPLIEDFSVAENQTFAIFLPKAYYGEIDDSDGLLVYFNGYKDYKFQILYSVYADKYKLTSILPSTDRLMKI